MDLANLTPESDTLEIILYHPTTLDPLMNEDGETEMSVVVYAPHSKEYKEKFNEKANKRLQVMQRSKKNQVTVEDLEKDAVDLVARIIKNWDITYDGEQPDLSVAKAKEVFETLPWLRIQIEEAIEENRGFIKA
jgi:hypothetical protein